MADSFRNAAKGNNACALSKAGPRDGRANARSAAGDEDEMILYSEIHNCSCLGVRSWFDNADAQRRFMKPPSI
jgi:hypothetical protein